MALTIVGHEGKPSNSGTCVTPTSAKVAVYLDLCCAARPVLSAVVGRSGSGKTNAVRQYAASKDGEIAYCAMIDAAGDMRSALRHIAAEIGAWSDRTLSALEASGAIEDQLRSRRVSLLVIDESQVLDDAALNCVRCISDRRRIGVAFVGDLSLHDRLSGKRSGKRSANRRDLDPVRGRLMRPLVLRGPAGDDVNAIAEHNGLGVGGSGKLLADIAKQAGGLHNVAGALAIARDLVGEGDLSAGAVREAVKLVEVER